MSDVNLTQLKSTDRVSTDGLRRSDGVMATSVRMIFLDVGEPSPLWAEPFLSRQAVLIKGSGHDIKE